jgi:hypothetical protein
VQPPSQVLLNGTVFPPSPPAETGTRANQWWWNPSTFELHLTFHASDFRLDLQGVRIDQYQN